MSAKDSMGKPTENLDEAAGAAPTERFLDEVDSTEFGTTDEEPEGESAENSNTTKNTEDDDS